MASYKSEGLIKKDRDFLKLELEKLVKRMKKRLERLNGNEVCTKEN